MTATKDTPMTASDITRLHAKIDTLTEAISEVSSEQKAQRVLCGQRLLVVDKHDKLLNGNGEEGLITRMVKVQTTVEATEESQKKTTKWLRGLVGTVVLGLLAMLSQVIGVEVPDVNSGQADTETTAGNEKGE